MRRLESRGVYRFIGIWDLLLTLPFALPFLNQITINLMRTLNSYLSPIRDFSEFSNIHLFFVQLFGIMAVLWALVRIHKPERFLAIYDSIGRMIVGTCMILFALNGGSLIALIFSVSEIGLGIIQIVYLIKNNQNRLN